jgi:glycosyltransferase involved in cell wall biosynthesis
VGDAGAAVNAGVAAARGRYAAVLDGVDAVTPGFLLRALQMAETERPETIARPGVVVQREAPEEALEKRRAFDEPRGALEAVEQADTRGGGKVSTSRVAWRRESGTSTGFLQSRYVRRNSSGSIVSARAIASRDFGSVCANAESSTGSGAERLRSPAL